MIYVDLLLWLINNFGLFEDIVQAILLMTFVNIYD